MTNPLAVAITGKGFSNLLKRSLVIGKRYGLTPARMDHLIGRFAQVLADFDCRATFPLTACTLTRSNGVLEKYQNQGIEFAIHGYYHVDHSQLPLEQQLDHLNKAQQMFKTHHLGCSGFRCPYLRWNQDTLTALGLLNFGYDSSQALAWDVVGGFETEAYHRVLGFYRAQAAGDYPSLPRLTDNLMQIPYCLPDDEALVDRLRLTDPAPMTEIWSEMLRLTYESGELFTLGLHPERIALCEEPLRALLSQARSASPSIWITRLDEIASWWRSRTEATVETTDMTAGRIRLTVAGPPGTTLLVRAIKTNSLSTPWADGYRLVQDTQCVVQTEKRPFIGLSPSTSPALGGFLQQQGYIIEDSQYSHLYTLYLDQSIFGPEDQRPLLARIEAHHTPLVRLARWPYGHRSALAITGDIDALTLWDYMLRFLRR